MLGLLGNGQPLQCCMLCHKDARSAQRSSPSNIDIHLAVPACAENACLQVRRVLRDGNLDEARSMCQQQVSCFVAGT